MGLFGKKGPPSAEQVAKRARVLAYMVMRSAVSPPPDMLAMLREQWSDDDWQKVDDLVCTKSQDILKQIKSENLWDAVSRDERRIFGILPIKLTPQDAINVSWRNESLRTLLWVLGFCDEPGPYDEETEQAENVKACLESVIPASSNLRPADELEHQRSIAEMWHWRSRTRSLQEGPDPIPLPAGYSIEDVIRMSAELMVERGAFPITIGDDFPAMGKPYRDLTDEEWSFVRSITMERHFALNWVCGFAPKNDWDRTPTNT